MTAGTFLYAPFTLSITTSSCVFVCVRVCVRVCESRGIRSLLRSVSHYIITWRSGLTLTHTHTHTQEDTHCRYTHMLGYTQAKIQMEIKKKKRTKKTGVNCSWVCVKCQRGYTVMKSYDCRGTLVDSQRAFIIPFQYDWV